MTNKTQGIIDIAAAVLVMFLAMIDPRLSVVFAVVFLVAFGVLKLKSGPKP